MIDLIPLFNGRKVTLDTNILVSYIISKKDKSVVKSVVTKTIRDDEFIITDIIRDEVLAYADKNGALATRSELQIKLDGLAVPIIAIGPALSAKDLQRKYGIRDIEDGKILNSVETTESVILVIYDDDFFDGKLKGVDVEVMDPVVYLFEDDVKSGNYKPKWANNGRLFKICRGGGTMISFIITSGNIGVDIVGEVRTVAVPRPTDSDGSASTVSSHFVSVFGGLVFRSEVVR